MASARMRTPSTQIAEAASHGTTSVSSSRSFPANIGRNTGGPSAAPNSIQRGRTKFARLRSSGTCPPTAVRARITAPFITPDAGEADDTRGCRVDEAAERSRGAGRQKPTRTRRSRRHAAVAIHAAAAGKRGERARGEEDRRPEAEDRLDPGDEDERDRRHGDRELQHAGEGRQAEGRRTVFPLICRGPRRGASLAQRNLVSASQ